ncbi:MAG TPA: tetratricopeptide repeat protein [Candidatus Krumholzibacteria bacterium]|nr:tetratricopeptide repeat protein [Candidatus Krumholzibacteria bacterium]
MYDESNDQTTTVQDKDPGASKESPATERVVLQALEGLAHATDRLVDEVKESSRTQDAAWRGSLADGLDGVVDQVEHRLSKERGQLESILRGAMEEILAAKIDELRELAGGKFDSDELEETVSRRAELLENSLAARLSEVLQESLARYLELRGDSPADGGTPSDTSGPVSSVADTNSGELRNEDTGAIVETVVAQFEDKLKQALSEHDESVNDAFASRVEKLLDEAMAKRAEADSEGYKSALQESLDEQKDSAEQMLREQLQSLKESLEQSIASLKEEVRTQAEALRKVFEESSEERSSQLSHWHEEQNERIGQIESETKELSSMGERIEKSHGEISQFFEDQRKRAQAEEDRQRKEEARRLNNAGVSAYHAGEFETALGLFEKAIERDVRFSQAFNNLGLTLTELDRHEEAQNAFESALELDPELGATYNNLGYALFLQENYEAAIQMYKEAVGRHCDVSAAWTNLGNAHHKLGETEKAVQAWQHALEADPGNERAQSYLEQVTAGMNRDSSKKS